MRAGDEYSELSELGVGSGAGGAGIGGIGVGSGVGGVSGPSGIPSSSDRLYGTTKSGPSSTTGSWTRSRSRGGVATDLDDALAGGGGGSPHAHTRSRSGLYYSPPGTSYTIVERPSSALHHHREYTGGGGVGSVGYGLGANSIVSPRGTYLGSNPNFHSQQPPHRPTSSTHHHTSAYHSHLHHGSNNKKRPISPEQVLRLFNNQSGSGGGKHPGTVTTTGVERPRRSPASSPPSTTHNYHHHRPAPPPLTVHELSTRTVTMIREPPEGSHGFGICVKGGKDAGGIGVYISRVEEGSVAERAGLRPGDTILEVNGTPFTAVSHEDALKMLKSCKKLSMTVKSPTLPGGGVVVPGLTVGGGGGSASGAMGGTWPVRQTCSWMDRQGRPVSPPLEYSRPTGIAPPRSSYGYSGGRSVSKDRSVRRVDLCIEPGQSLGLMIRGGVEYNLGIFVTGVDKDSVADRAGLMVGDQILDVNGQSFMEVTHDEAVSQLKYHKRMSLLVRDVGKVPHSCTAYDREWDLCSPGSRAAQTTRKWAAALQMVEEKARCILAKHEFTTLCYYTDEYSARHMTIDAFVQVMTELLNTPDKYTLMIELREIVAVEDRMKFDELVYRRDSGDTLPRGRLDPRDSDYRHSRRKGDLNHSNLMMSSAYQELQDSVGGGGGGGFDYNTYKEDEYRSPSEDSGLGLPVCDRLQRTRCPGRKAINTSGVEYHRDQDYCDENGGRRHSSPGESRTGSTTALHQPDYPDSSGYLVGLRSSLGGWTQKVKSWYWGRPLELAHKLSRSFDMKDEQSLLDGDGTAGGGPGLRRHQSMQRLAGHGGGSGALIGNVVPAGGIGGPGADGGIPIVPGPPRVVTDAEGNLRVTVRKTKPILGIAIEGGANTKHPLPRIININENGAAYCAGGLEVGQLILQVDGAPVDGLQHQNVARLIAESFARRDRDDIEFLVVEAKKSNMEPKPTALIFLEA